MEKKNQLLAGLFNSLVPGSGYWYVDKDRGRFIRTLIMSAAAIAVMVLLAGVFQRASGFPVTQGVCTGILLIPILVPLFLSGRKIAMQHNSVLENATRYTARQSGSNEVQLTSNQDLRDKGLISKQEFDSRKDSINQKK